MGSTSLLSELTPFKKAGENKIVAVPYIILTHLSFVKSIKAENY